MLAVRYGNPSTYTCHNSLKLGIDAAVCIHPTLDTRKKMVVAPSAPAKMRFTEMDLNTNIEIDPWKVNVKEDFESLIDLVSLNPTKKNKTEKKRIKK